MHIGIITPNPLKQGLKRYFIMSFQALLNNYYPKSTKTRIETPYARSNALNNHIITPNPLKQGLKPTNQQIN